MNVVRNVGLAAASVAALAACSSVSLAPGADQVTVVHAAADVASCTELGALTPPATMMTDPDARRQLQNEAFNRGGNVLLVTSSYGRSGVAYRCGQTAPSSAVQPTPSSAALAAPVMVPAGPAPEQVVQAQVEAFNRHDLAAFLSFFADDARIIDYPDQPLAAGKDSVRAFYGKYFEPASQLHAAIVRRSAFDRFVIDREQVTGTVDGQVAEGVVIYEVRDGRIVRETFLRP